MTIAQDAPPEQDQSQKKTTSFKQEPPKKTPQERHEAHDEMADKTKKEQSNNSQENNQSKIKRIFHPYSYSELRQRPPKKWIVDNLIGVRDSGMIYGPPGLGKTFIVIDMIACMCSGKTFANFFSIEQPLNVAYFAGEGIDALPSRFESSVKYHELDDLINFDFYETPPQLFNDETTETMQQFIQEHKANSEKKYNIIFIDTLHSATVGAEENSAKDMGKVLSMCKFASKELSCSVILVHHTNKNATAERGSSSLRGAMDFMIEICGSQEKSYIKCAKLKDGKSWQPIRFNLCDTEECESAHVEWLEGIYTENEDPSNEEIDKQKLIEHMELHEGFKFTVGKLKNSINKSDTMTRKLVNKLFDEAKCNRSTKDPKRKLSNTNPYVYWIDPY